MQSVMIPLTKNKVAIIDEDDYEKVCPFKWCALHKCRERFEAFSYRIGKMHRFIMNCPKGLEIDHKNGNSLDNRKSNLRICTHAQNMANRTMHINNSTGFKGVEKLRKFWRARITANYKQYRLGCFNSPVEAAFAYDRAAVEKFGEFARLNFPNEIKRSDLQTFIDSSGGRIIKVAFDKRSDNNERIMFCRKGVMKQQNGRGLAFDPNDHNLVIVYDMQKRMYRAIPLDSVKALWMNKKKYKVA
jgi:hypothetical protein